MELLNASFSKKIFIPYMQSEKFYNKWKDRVVVSGNPVRKEFLNSLAQEAKDWLNYQGDKPILLVIGGSLGAQSINELVLTHLDQLCRDYFVVHQMGQEGYIASNRENYRSYPYIHQELAGIMRASSLALSRAGAGSLWELAFSLTPMVLLPLKIGSRGDQLRNGAIFEKMGLAMVLDEENLTSQRLTDTLKWMGPMGDGGKKAAQLLSKEPLPNAVEIIMENLGEELT
jgi:UDP-N-acetylglucosamine--N-acetylmuramyl-(pentapeptide) pyrophosphoryl-undecaprenol N-acetylglucosamine transferase